MKKIFVHFKNQALCTSAEEAINFINSLKGISCNVSTQKNIEDLFAGRGYYGNKPLTEIATTGCGVSRIYVYEALGDTLEEHIIAYDTKKDAEKRDRLNSAKAAMQQRLTELNEQKKGWYYVSIDNIRVDGFRTVGNDRPKYKDFSVKLIANSGADAYEKVRKHLDQTLPNELMTMDFTYSGHFLPDVTSSDFYFEFLGVKTDEGYSVEKWEEWKNTGVI